MKYLNNPFETTTCPECNKRYDAVRAKCPQCNHENEELDPRKREFDRLIPLGPIREIGLFLIGFVALFALAQIIGIIAINVVKSGFISRGFTQSEILGGCNEYAESVELSLLMNDLAYGIIFVCMLLYIWKDNLRLWKSFAHVKTLYGILFGIAIIILSAIWNMIAQVLGGTTNDNQTAVNEMISSAPFLAILITGLVGPFVEELTYRVGAFTFLKRINTVFAYIAIGVLFGLIHIKNFGSLNEWLSYPSYLIAGLVLCFAYDKFGFGVAYTAHAFNNTFGVLLAVIAGAMSR